MRDIIFQYLYRTPHDKIIKEEFTLDDFDEYDSAPSYFFVDCECIARRQYTGLNDKNGVDVFEDDIVYSENIFLRGVPLVVCFENGRFYGKSKNNGNIQGIRNLTDQPIEVIGNIYESPELLEQNHD